MFYDTRLSPSGLARTTPEESKRARARSVRIRGFLAKRKALSDAELEEESLRLEEQAAAIIDALHLTPRSGAIY